MPFHGNAKSRARGAPFDETDRGKISVSRLVQIAYATAGVRDLLLVRFLRNYSRRWVKVNNFFASERPAKQTKAAVPSTGTAALDRLRFRESYLFAVKTSPDTSASTVTCCGSNLYRCARTAAR